jgi:ubiquinone/menaquinone biosynthesis C-methylase UbiE/catechol 2,3-dioxygenase-like lactoylglutathione lyase family enzyme
VTVAALSFCGCVDARHGQTNASHPNTLDPTQFKARPIAGASTGDITLVAQPSAPPADAPAANADAADPQAYTVAKASRDGIGKFYMGREIAQVMGHLAAGWLERPEREREEKPAQVVQWMELKKTDVVADIGAGTGYFSFRIAEQVPDGKVLATDIQPEMLDLLRRQATAKGLKNVEPLLGKIDDPNLPEAAVDVVLMVDAYHEFDHPREMLAGIVKGLKVGGRVVLVEYRGEDPTVQIKPLHKLTQDQAKKELGAAGMEYVKTFDGLPSQHVMIFRKPEPAAAPAAPGSAPAAPPAPEKVDDVKRLVLDVAPRFAVSKIDASVAYYRDKLGFRVDKEEHGFAIVSRDGVAFQLILPEEKPTAPRDVTQFAADCDAYVYVRDANALHDEFRKNGALIAQPPQKRRDAIEFDVATPDGGVIRFAQRVGGSSSTPNP